MIYSILNLYETYRKAASTIHTQKVDDDLYHTAAMKDAWQLDGVRPLQG